MILRKSSDVEGTSAAGTDVKNDLVSCNSLLLTVMWPMALDVLQMACQARQIGSWGGHFEDSKNQDDG